MTKKDKNVDDIISVFENPVDLFEIALSNENLKKNFIDEMNEIIQLMKNILLTPPYVILFGRINIEASKHIIQHKINDDFYDGLGLEEFKK